MTRSPPVLGVDFCGLGGRGTRLWPLPSPQLYPTQHAWFLKPPPLPITPCVPSPPMLHCSVTHAARTLTHGPTGCMVHLPPSPASIRRFLVLARATTHCPHPALCAVSPAFPRYPGHCLPPSLVFCLRSLCGPLLFLLAEVFGCAACKKNLAKADEDYYCADCE